MALVHTKPELLCDQIALAPVDNSSKATSASRPIRPGARTGRLSLLPRDIPLHRGQWRPVDSRRNRARYLDGRPVNARRLVLTCPRSDRRATIYEHAQALLVNDIQRVRIAADRIGRLERRDEPRRQARQRRERVAAFPLSRSGKFAEVARLRNDSSFADRCDTKRYNCDNRSRRTADGEWYRRAYFDDGSPRVRLRRSNRFGGPELGGTSGAGDAVRSRAAMNAVNARLVRRDAR